MGGMPLQKYGRFFRIENMRKIIFNYDTEPDLVVVVVVDIMKIGSLPSI